jgi:hypothetical protein
MIESEVPLSSGLGSAVPLREMSGKEGGSGIESERRRRTKRERWR